MAKKRDTYIAGQTLQNKVEIDEFGNRTVTQKVIYEQREFVEGYTDVRLPIKHKFQNGGFITVFQEALLLWCSRGRQPHRGGQGGVYSGDCGRAGDLSDDRYRQHRLAGS